MGMTTPADRLFLLLDPHTRRVADICTGPTATGDCPAYLAGQPLTCAGFRVVPLRRTSANGLPFLVDEAEGPRCPLAWLDSGVSEGAGGAIVETVPDPDGWIPPEGEDDTGRAAFHSIS
jgi:hypothetical protein